MTPHEIITLIAFVSPISFWAGTAKDDDTEAIAALLFCGSLLSAAVAITLRFVG